MASDSLDYEVIATTVGSMAANMVLIKGETEALLVDTPFARSDAHRVVAAILDSGKILKTIFITHDHPDHFFGLDVVTDAFPEAKVVAHPTVAKDIERSLPIKFERWSPMLGANAPQRQVGPKALTTDEVYVEGHALKVVGPMQGDHVHATALWDAASKTLVAGDFVFNHVFPWLGEHLEPEYAAWLKSLDTIESMQPNRIIAGHTKPGMDNDVGSVAWTRKYIETFEKTAKEKTTSQDLASAIYALYPDTIDVAGGFLVGVSSQVGSREIPPWDE